MSSAIWDQLEQCWPITIAGQEMSYQELRTRVGDFLKSNSIAYRHFSHFGVVVPSIEQALEDINKLTKGLVDSITRDYVQAAQVSLARVVIEQIELEFVEPSQESFLTVSLRERGACLQHISFDVENIEKALGALRDLDIPLIHEKPVRGSHGKVAFCQPKLFEPLYLELCQSI